MLSNQQKVVGHVSPGPTYGDTPDNKYSFLLQNVISTGILGDKGQFFQLAKNYSLCRLHRRCANTLFFEFVCFRDLRQFQWTPFYLVWICKKKKEIEGLFPESTLLPNIFTPYHHTIHRSKSWRYRQVLLYSSEKK